MIVNVLRIMAVPMTILHIEAGRHLYGGAFQVRSLLQGLSHQGVSNILVCPCGSDIARAASQDATVVELPMHGDLDMLFPFRLCSLIRQYKPDIVHVHSRRGADLVGGWCAKWCGVPALITRRVAYREWRPLLRLKYSPYQRIIGISEGALEAVRELGFSDDRVGRIYSVIQASEYGVAPEPAWFCKTFGVSAEARVVGVPAQLIESKGHRYVIEAMPTVLAALPQARVIFFGKGAYQPELERMIKEASLEQVIQFAGFRDDMPRILPNLDVVVLPTLMEGLGVSLLQASAARVPVIGTRVGGVPEVVRDGLNGLLVEPRDPAGLASAILAILTDRQRAKQMGDAGLALVQAEFVPDVMVRDYLQEYRALLKAGERA